MLHDVKDGDVRAVHRTRVASRRLREVLPVLQLDPAVSEKMGRRLRKVTDRLGTVRELDVMLAVIDELKQTERYPSSALERLAAAVRADREHAHGRLGSKRAVNELTRLGGKLEKLARLLEEEDSTARGGEASIRSRRWVLEARAARRAASLSSAMKEAGAFYEPVRLHGVRIAAKKLRYALEVSADAAGIKSSPDLRLLRRTQDALGRLHDLQMLVDRVRELQASLTVPDVTAWRQLDTLVFSLEDECRRLHGRYMRDREALAALTVRLSGGREREGRGRAQHSK